MDLKSYFTTNEQIEEWEDRDPTTNLVGYVDSIVAPTPSGPKQELLFKFILSNGSKKIIVLIWDVKLINKFHKDICSNRVLNINGAYCRATRVTKVTEENNIAPFELIVKENTTITFMGYYLLTNATPDELHQVTFDDIQNVEGLIEITGYIRTQFSLIHNRSGLTNYGIGAITDGKKKLTIQVKQFVDSRLEIGDHVKIKGIVKGQDSLVTVFCNDMTDIELDAETEPMKPEIVQCGCRPVKRIRSK